MINCEEIGKVTISGDAAEILAEYAFITNCLLRTKIIEQRDLIGAFSAGLFKQEIDDSGKSAKECWDLIDKIIDEAFGKEGKNDRPERNTQTG